MSRLVSFAVLIGILIVIVVLFYQVMAVFLLPLFMAALLGVVFQPLYRWAFDKFWKNRYVAAGVTTFLVLLMVLAPAGLVVTMAALQSISVIERVQATDVAGKATALRKKFDLDIPDQVDLHQFDATRCEIAGRRIEGRPGLGRIGTHLLGCFERRARPVAAEDHGVFELRSCLRRLGGQTGGKGRNSQCNGQ